MRGADRDVRCGPVPGRRATLRVLAAGAGLVAATAYAGAVALATGIDPYLRPLTDRLPLHSPVLAGVALILIVGLPYTVLAAYLWSAHGYAGLTAVIAGLLMVGWRRLTGRGARSGRSEHP